MRRGLQCPGVTFCQNINHNLLIAKPQGTISSDIVHTMFSLSFTYLFLFAISRRGHHTDSSGSTIKAWPSYQFIRVYQSAETSPLPFLLSISSIKFLHFMSFFTVSFHVFVNLSFPMFSIIVFSRIVFAKFSTFICLRCLNHLSQCPLIICRCP